MLPMMMLRTRVTLASGLLLTRLPLRFVGKEVYRGVCRLSTTKVDSLGIMCAMEIHTLYQFETCPFCARVRRFLIESGLSVPMKDVQRDPAARRELVEGGGSGMVPCLRIERDGAVTWLYESLDIIEYLRNRLPQRA